MVAWQGWPLQRVMVLFSAIVFLLLWLQLTLFHWKAGFRDWRMWGPVAYTPFMVLGAIVLTIGRGRAPEFAYQFLFGLGMLEGLIGCLLHLRGVRRLKRGLTRRNLAAGPPLFLPLLYLLLALDGYLAVLGL